MKYLIAPYIYPIMVDDETVGQGFAADGYLFTAAHVVRDYPECFIELGEMRIQLSSFTPNFIGKGDIDIDSHLTDVAIYKLGDKDSPLHLNIQTPQPPNRFISSCVYTNFDSEKNQYYNCWNGNV